MLIAKLKDLGRVTLVGEATGGSAEGPTAGNLLMLRLPASGILVRVPLIFSRMDIRAFEPGLGVKPDVEVKQTLEDFLAGKDSVMEWVRAESRKAQ
jgi:C-terminal processing protease CtpA/Prc